MKQYVARMSLDDDEAAVVEADSRAELAEMVIDTIIDWANHLLETENHRVYKLIAACEMILEVAKPTMEVIDKFMGGAELPLVTDLWEFHESGQDPRGPG